MRAPQLIENLPNFTPALGDIAGISSLSPNRGRGIDGFAGDLEGLSALPEFESSSWGRVIPVDRGLNAKPLSWVDLGTDRRTGTAYTIMNVHGEIRNALGQGLDAMGHLAEYSSELGPKDRVRAGRAVKAFAGFAIVRATQVDFAGWRRGSGSPDFDGEGRYIARHANSYIALRPLMTKQFRRLADHAIDRHSH